MRIADIAQTYTDLVTTVFSSTIAAKAWFATAAVVLALVQVTTAARIYGRLSFLPERAAGDRPRRTAGRDGSRSCSRSRCSSTASSILGFQTPNARVALHAIVGTFFYGVFAAKVLVVRDHSLPGWVAADGRAVRLPSMLGVLWLTSSLWYFTTVRFGF